MEASDIKRLKELEPENGRLKRMYADLSLENAALKHGIAKKTLRPTERREVVAHMVSQGGLPVQRTCRAVGLDLLPAPGGLAPARCASDGGPDNTGGCEESGGVWKGVD